MTQLRRLVYDYFSLPAHVRIQIFEKIGVIEKNDDVWDTECIKNLFSRVAERNLLKEFEEEVKNEKERLSKS